MDLDAPVTRLELLATHQAFGTTIGLLVTALSDTSPELRERMRRALSSEMNSHAEKGGPFSSMAGAVLGTVLFELAAAE